jgi:hypothetical protein
MAGILDGLGMGVCSWFDNNIKRVVGDGSTIFFWSDNWVGGVPLRVRISRLFDLVENPWCSVAGMCRLE